MRPDFDKVLCERPRRGGGLTQRRRSDNEKKWEHLPVKEGMRRPHIRHWNGKELSDNIAPLYRYLQGTVGRQWNDVYSEIREMIGKNPNAVKGHILQHIHDWQGIELNTFSEGKKRFHNVSHSLSNYDEVTKTYKRSRQYTELRHNQLYVNDNGIICKYQRAKKDRRTYRQIQEEKWMETARTLPNGNQARKINGIWFEIVLSPILDSQIMTTWSAPSKYTLRRFSTETPLVNDVLRFRGEVKDFIAKYKAKVYASSKKAMSSKDLKKYELTND